MSRRNFLATAVPLLVALAPPVFACGHCIEDKVAATYDYRVLEEAQRHGHRIAYAEITGAAVGGPQMSLDVQRRVSQTPGIVGASVRVSVAPPAVSFAWDPAGHDLDQLLAAINRALAAQQLQLSLLRQWDTQAGLR